MSRRVTGKAVLSPDRWLQLAVRTLARADLDQAMLKLYAWRVDQLIDTGRPVHERLVTARNMLSCESRVSI